MYSTKQWSSSFIINIFKYSDYVHKNVVIVCYYFIIITQIKLSTLKMRQSGLFILKTSVCSYFRMDIGTLHNLGSVLSIPSKSKTLLSGNNLLWHQSICYAYGVNTLGVNRAYWSRASSQDRLMIFLYCFKDIWRKGPTVKRKRESY